jgi:hypothetical protein
MSICTATVHWNSPFWTSSSICKNQRSKLQQIQPCQTYSCKLQNVLGSKQFSQMVLADWSKCRTWTFTMLLWLAICLMHSLFVILFNWCSQFIRVYTQFGYYKKNPALHKINKRFKKTRQIVLGACILYCNSICNWQQEGSWHGATFCAQNWLLRS